MTQVLRNGIFGGDPGLNIDMKEDPEIKHLKIKSTSGLKISSIAGNKLSSIDISGSNLDINNLCSLIVPKNVENLKSLNVRDATIVNFGGKQLQDCNRENLRNAGNQLKVCITFMLVFCRPCLLRTRVLF